MKNLGKVSLVGALLLSVSPLITSCGGVGQVIGCSGKETLDVFNWGSYIDEDVLTSFEKEYNVCVNYSTFDSNETAVQKLKSGEVYDVIFPSEYAIEELIEADLLQPIDWSKVTTMTQNDVTGGVSSMINELKSSSVSFDFYKYAVPFFWGSVGIVYDTSTVKLADLEAKNWDILKDPTYKVGYYDTSRDAFIAPLKTLGYSMNTTNSSEVNAAVSWLNDQKDVMGSKISYVGDDVIEDMAASNNRYDMAVVYSGDAVYQMMNNSKLSFYKPSVGTNVWVDGMVIHKKSSKVDLAHKFISYMMSDENATANSLYVGYSSVKDSVYQNLLKEDMADYANGYEVTFNETVDEVFRYNEVSRKLINDGWASVKLH